VVDEDILLRKAAQVEHHVARLRQRLPLEAETLHADEDLGDLTLLARCLRDHARG